MRDHREQIGAQRVLVTCSRCGEQGYFDWNAWIHLNPPATKHRFVPMRAPSEKQQDQLERQHRVDFGPMPDPHSIDSDDPWLEYDTGRPVVKVPSTRPREVPK